MIDFGSEVRTALKAQGRSLRGTAKELHYDVSYLSRVLNGKQAPSPELIQALNEYLGLSLAVEDCGSKDDEMDAWELARRVQASDVGNATLERLELSFDRLAMAYPKSQPEDLLRQVRKHAGYVVKLLDGKKTLSEHRRLLVLGGWLSLLGATVHVDLMQDDAATARLETAATLAREAGHSEIEAWCFETEAWRVLTDGDYVRAIDLARAGQQVAPAGTSAMIQATAQEGRANARLGNVGETYSAIDRVQSLCGRGNPRHPRAPLSLRPCEVSVIYGYNPCLARGRRGRAICQGGHQAPGSE
ncbi:helix-turn-helix domain-containing protein [Streptomyces alkaliterrae]|uniref:helix-turn-helix domain-containing protein n=1 Tax=Streptomyces alkaliterrae TaxID=2213162 RepID=UPI001E61E450|nr:helix-turn-helix domain-containing protein [Streptomyces alkaliterrae]